MITTQSRFDELTAELDKQCEAIVAEKRKVYTNGDADTLKNFQINAMLANTTVGNTIAFGLVKQITAVVSALTMADNTDAEAESRFADAINYLKIAYVAYKEGRTHG